jgi:hypothetical protein
MLAALQYIVIATLEHGTVQLYYTVDIVDIRALSAELKCQLYIIIVH